MLDWLREHVWWVGIASAAVFAGSPAAAAACSLPAVRVTLIVLKNVLGVVLVIVGLLLSLPLVPGPGLLAVLVGVSLTDFPGKRRLERWLLGKRFVLAPLNWLRARWGRPALLSPE